MSAPVPISNIQITSQQCLRKITAKTIKRIIYLILFRFIVFKKMLENKKGETNTNSTFGFYF